MSKKPAKRAPFETKKTKLHLPESHQIEGFMGGIFAPETPVEAAQEIMYDAWESADRKKRIALAKKALEVSGDCADAFVLLASETAKTVDEAIELYRKGVEAGERALGETAFTEDVGHFWGLIETRPYMRARAGLAAVLWDTGKREEAIGHYKDMLRLNPGDNQGLRYRLMTCLLHSGSVDAAEELYKQFEDDSMAAWAYSRVLLNFRRSGDSLGTRESLRAAIETNAHVPAYLLGMKELPAQLPGYYSFGDDNEAVLYAVDNWDAWRATPGALGWLKANAPQ